MYMKKTTKYGNRIEIRKYHTFRCPGKGEQKRGERKMPTKEQMAEANERRACKKLMMLLVENFEFGDWHLVLTYAPDKRPDVDGSKRILKRFFEKARKAYKKAGVEFKYIMVTEWESKSIHHHLAIKDVPGISRLIQELWEMGGVHLTPLYANRDYEGLAEYFVKETKRTFRKEENPYKQRWTRSRNLKEPEVHTEKVKANSWREEPSVPKSLEKRGYVIDKNSIVTDVDGMGYPFQEYVMVCPDRGRKW